MPLTFRGVDQTAILGNPLTAAGSLRMILQAAEPGLLTGLQNLWTTHRNKTAPITGTAYRSALGAFSSIEGFWGNTYSALRLANLMFTQNAAGTTAITGANDAADLMTRFEAARDEAFYVVLQKGTVEILSDASFKGTYYHQDIEHVFLQRPHSMVTAIISKRVIETAQVVLRMLYGNMNTPWRQLYSTRTFATTLLLCEMHNVLLGPYVHRGHCVWNQSSAAFTLLTFSYPVAAEWIRLGHELDVARWYYFWKIVGSLLGIDAGLIADTHVEAGTLWTEFFRSGECKGGTPAPPPQYFQENRVDRRLIDPFEVNPEWNLIQWVPSFVVTQLRNLPRWRRYFNS